MSSIRCHVPGCHACAVARVIPGCQISRRSVLLSRCLACRAAWADDAASRAWSVDDWCAQYPGEESKAQRNRFEAAMVRGRESMADDFACWMSGEDRERFLSVADDVLRCGIDVRIAFCAVLSGVDVSGGRGFVPFGFLPGWRVASDVLAGGCAGAVELARNVGELAGLCEGEAAARGCSFVSRFVRLAMLDKVILWGVASCGYSVQRFVGEGMRAAWIVRGRPLTYSDVRRSLARSGMMLEFVGWPGR